MRLRKNMKRTAAAVLALSMAVSAVAAPASAAYICDVSKGDVVVSRGESGKQTTITVGGVAVEDNGDGTDDIVITGDNTKSTASLNAAEEKSDEVEKSGENTSEVEKSGETEEQAQEPGSQELLAPEDEEKKDEQKKTEQKPADSQEPEQDKKTEQTSDQVIEYGQYDPEAQQEAAKPAAKPAAEQKAEEKKAAEEKTYGDTNAPTTLSEGVQTAARNVVKIINDSKETLRVILRNLKVDAGDTAQNAMTIEGKGKVTLELDGKTELTGGSGTFKDRYDNDQKGYGIDATKNNSLTIKGNEGSSLTANGGVGGGCGIYAYGLELDNADVTANGGSGGFGTSDGVCTGGQLNIKHSKLTATGGSREATGNKSVYGSRGIYNYSTEGTVIGEGSEVVATGGNVKSENGEANGGEGISFYYGGLEIQKGGKLTATGGNAESESGKANGGSGFLGFYGNMESSGETTLIGGNAKSGSGNAVAGSGISGSRDLSTGNVTVKEGTTTALGGTAEGADGKATNGNSFTGIGGTNLYIEKDGTFVTAKPGESGGNGISGYVNNNGKIEEVKNAEVVKKDDGTVEVVGDLVGIKQDGHSYEITIMEPTCTTPGKRVYTCTTHEGETYEETIDALGHHFVEGVCTRCGAPESSGGSSAVTLTVTGAGAYETSIADGRYVVAAPAETAVLSGCLGNLKELKAQGVNTLVFRTKLRETALNIDSMLSLGVDGTLFTLTHSGESAELTVGGFAHNELLH